MAKEAKARKPRRDVRVDYIGLVGELEKHWIDDKKSGVKMKVKAGLEVGDVVLGDLFEGHLHGTTVSEISISGVLKLYENRSISRADLVELISGISSDAAKKIIDPKALKRLQRTFPGTPRLNVDRRKGYELSLAEAARKIFATLASAEPARKQAA
jgi:hypothetical protein